jgi:hypothetical protein
MLGERVTVAPAKSYVKRTTALSNRPLRKERLLGMTIKTEPTRRCTGVVEERIALFAGLLGPFCQRLQKRICSCRRFDLPLERGFGADHVPVEFSGAVFVLTNDAAVER